MAVLSVRVRACARACVAAGAAASRARLAPATRPVAGRWRCTPSHSRRRRAGGATIHATRVNRLRFSIVMAGIQTKFRNRETMGSSDLTDHGSIFDARIENLSWWKKAALDLSC